MIHVGPITIGAGHPLVLIAGPCVLEEERLVLSTAERLARLADNYHLPLIFKSSYEKDNRTAAESYRGPGLAKGLQLLDKVRQVTGLPLLTDVHRVSDVAEVAARLDVVQVPAFLCRQTSLLLEVGRCARVVNLKKGQFAAPQDLTGSVDKLREGGAQQILLTERGSCFGYHRLIADMTAIPQLQALGCPVAFDATHIVRHCGIPGDPDEGRAPQLIGVLARAGVAAGADALFIETHPAPREARCDAATMLPLDDLPRLLDMALPIAAVVRS